MNKNEWILTKNRCDAILLPCLFKLQPIEFFCVSLQQKIIIHVCSRPFFSAMKTGSILIIDDNHDVLLSLRLLLKHQYASVHTEHDHTRVAGILQQTPYDVIIMDMNFTANVMSGEEGLALLKQIHAIDDSAVVIAMTAYGDVSIAVRAIKEGAVDFVLKPWDNDKLLATVSSAMQLSESRKEVAKKQTEVETLKIRQKTLTLPLQPTQFLWKSTAMAEIARIVERVAPTDANVLILGENGTGKEILAREIHRLSLRSGEVFVSVDMGAIPASLFESELFGHAKGAFTDAKEHRAGKFEAAQGGTLLLDEIGNLPLALQPKLLTALQQRSITRLGTQTPIAINARLICATNVALEQLVERKEFRQDLQYRINTVEITLPPLRDRKDDIPLLADHFVELYSTKYRLPIKDISDSAYTALQSHEWRGNIRELQHSMERAVIMSSASILTADDFGLRSGQVSQQVLQVVSSAVTPPPSTLNLEELEKQAIQSALHKHQGNISHAAEELGITRAALYRRMEKFGV
jgi:two-component system, NtrC family, response regulator HydG